MVQKGTITVLTGELAKEVKRGEEKSEAINAGHRHLDNTLVSLNEATANAREGNDFSVGTAFNNQMQAFKVQHPGMKPDAMTIISVAPKRLQEVYKEERTRAKEL